MIGSCRRHPTGEGRSAQERKEGPHPLDNGAVVFHLSRTPGRGRGVLVGQGHEPFGPLQLQPLPHRPRQLLGVRLPRLHERREVWANQDQY